MARRIRTGLGNHCEMTVPDLERMVGASPQLVDYVLGWLAHNDQVDIFREEAGKRVRLKFD
jgi:hypothetical protein